MQAFVQVSIKVAEEYLDGGEGLSEPLKNLLFERSEEVSIQEKEEKKEKKKRSSYSCFDQIAALGTFTGDSDA